MSEWDEIDRRTDHDWLENKRKVISDIEDTKKDVKEIKADIVGIKLLMTEMKVEIKHIVGRSSATTSAVVSSIITVLGSVTAYFLSK